MARAWSADGLPPTMAKVPGAGSPADLDQFSVGCVAGVDTGRGIGSAPGCFERCGDQFVSGR